VVLKTVINGEYPVSSGFFKGFYSTLTVNDILRYVERNKAIESVEKNYKPMKKSLDKCLKSCSVLKNELWKNV